MVTTATVNEEFLTEQEVAKRAAVCPKTVANWRKQGLPYIKASRLVRLRWSAVQAWLAEREVVTTSAGQ